MVSIYYIITPYISVYHQEIGIIMQENSFHIPCHSYSWKSKHFVKITLFSRYISTFRLKLLWELNYKFLCLLYFFCFSYGIRKEKTKLTLQFHSLFLFLQLFCFTLFY